MKKSLVLAMAMALGVTASAYAANPFSDVPAGHWAYDSISKLAAAGVIEGYGDDTFRGDRLMTRYEMAQIVAKAMAKGANVDKLAAEFADELDALGVRVAALEKKADNVKITGNIRYRYRTDTKGTVDHDLRTRLTFTGKVNDNWNYVGMMENIQTFHASGKSHDKSYVGEDNATDWQRAYLQGRLGGMKVTAGRYHEELVGGDSDVYSNRIDGIKVQYGDKVRLMGWYGKMAKKNTGDEAKDLTAGSKKSWGAHLGFDLGKSADLFVGYDALKATNDDERKIFDVGANIKFGKDLKATAIYLHGTQDNANDNAKKDGWTLQLAYKGAVASKPGSWGFLAKYYDQGNLTYVDHAAFTGKGAIAPAYAKAADGGSAGFKGFRLSADYTVAKNMVARVSYFDLKAKDPEAAKRKTYYGEMIVTF